MSDEMPGVSHIPGVATKFNGRTRQRCQWCGICIIDEDMALIAYQICDKPIDIETSCQRSPSHDGDCSSVSDHVFPTWEQGSFVFVSDGNPKWYSAVEWGDGTRVPENACLWLPPELTGSEDGQ